jgi:hypothetical protein
MVEIRLPAKLSPTVTGGRAAGGFQFNHQMPAFPFYHHLSRRNPMKAEVTKAQRKFKTWCLWVLVVD